MKTAIIIIIGAGIIGGLSYLGLVGPKVVIASPFTGQLLHEDNTPAAGVTILRHWTWDWSGLSGTQEVVTDDEGRFSFEIVTARMLFGYVFPHEPGTHQKINAVLPDGSEKRIFSASGHNYKLLGEAFGTKLQRDHFDMVCNIDAEPNGDGPFWVTCVERPVP